MDARPYGSDPEKPRTQREQESVNREGASVLRGSPPAPARRYGHGTPWKSLGSAKQEAGQARINMELHETMREGHHDQTQVAETTSNLSLTSPALTTIEESLQQVSRPHCKKKASCGCTANPTPQTTADALSVFCINSMCLWLRSKGRAVATLACVTRSSQPSKGTGASTLEGGGSAQPGWKKKGTRLRRVSCTTQEPWSTRGNNKKKERTMRKGPCRSVTLAQVKNAARG